MIEPIDILQENIEWARTERRTFLRQSLESRLIALYYDTQQYTQVPKDMDVFLIIIRIGLSVYTTGNITNIENLNLSQALQLGAQLLKELKKLDDKNLLVEVQLLESKVS